MKFTASRIASILLVSSAIFFGVSVAWAQTVKLPYAKGESFVVTTGYDSPPTHIKKDAYAIDFTQDGCSAYGKSAVAALAGIAWVVLEDGYNGGYGTELLIASSNGAGATVVSRYAHMIPDSIVVSSGTVIRQGMVLGKIGDTGLVAGNACATHPGSHLHFALYDATSSVGSSALSTSTFVARNPEPISGYTNIQEGRWYLSDNGLDDGASAGTGVGVVLGAATSDSFVLPPSVASTPPLPQPSGTVSVNAITIASTALPQTFTGSFNSSTLAVDFAWQVPMMMATSTGVTYSLFDLTLSTSAPAVSITTSTVFSYSIPDQDFGQSAVFSLQASDTAGDVFNFPQTTVAIPSWFDPIQLDSSAGSIPSWYDDNWYNLGTGFYGTIKSLTFRGAVDTDRYQQFSGTMELDEFLDAGYTQPNQAFTIPGMAQLTDQMATVTISGLDIPLQPNKYYRLSTVGPLQNHSILLAGTEASSTTGVAMWDEFINGTGIVRHTYQFYPYLSAIMVPDYPPLAPPNPPASLQFSFDQFTLTLHVNWPAATDPDTTGNLLTYQFNVSTSSVLDDSQWQPMGPSLATGIGVTVGNTYTVGVRTVDDFGATSTPIVQTWDFPAGFTPYILSSHLSTASQDFSLAAGSSTLHSIDLFTALLVSGSHFPEFNWCTLDLYDLAPSSTAPGAMPAPLYIASNDGFNEGYGGCQDTPVFTFDSSDVQLVPDHPYRWVFTMNTGNVSTAAAVQFWGTAANTASGTFSDPELVNAKFTINASSGILFSN